jgi:hypothetical protein
MLDFMHWCIPYIHDFMLPLNFIKGLSLGSGCIIPQELLTGQRFYLILKELGFGQTHGV